MKDLKFNTIEEMVAWVVARPSYDTRFNLCERSMWEEGDEAGKYYLRSPSAYGTSLIELSMKLGDELKNAWPKKPWYKGSEHLVPSGARTLAGILKLLGQDDITAKVKEAKAQAKAEDERRRRNSYRRVVNEKLVALVNAVDEANEVEGLHFELPSFGELLALLQEEG